MKGSRWRGHHKPFLMTNLSQCARIATGQIVGRCSVARLRPTIMSAINSERDTEVNQQSKPAAVICFVLASILGCGSANATVDGPDFYIVRGVASNDVLYIREKPSAD